MSYLQCTLQERIGPESTEYGRSAPKRSRRQVGGRVANVVGRTPSADGPTCVRGLAASISRDRRERDSGLRSGTGWASGRWSNSRRRREERRRRTPRWHEVRTPGPNVSNRSPIVAVERLFRECRNGAARKAPGARLERGRRYTYTTSNGRFGLSSRIERLGNLSIAERARAASPPIV